MMEGRDDGAGGVPGPPSRLEAPRLAEGDMRRLIEQHDWAETPLCAIGAWPQSLRTSIEVMLGLAVPATLFWGERQIQIYNDAYAALLGSRHPDALGKTWLASRSGVSRLESSEQERIGAGETLIVDDEAALVQRQDLLPRGQVRVGYSPVRDDHGKPGGLLVSLMPAPKLGSTKAYDPPGMPLRGHVATFQWDLSSDVISFSEAVIEVLGLLPGESLQSVHDHDRLVHPDDLERHQVEIERALRLSKDVRLEYRVIRPCDGQIALIEKWVTPVHGGGLKSGLVLGVLRDATRHHPAGLERAFLPRTRDEELSATRRLHQIALRQTDFATLPLLLDEVLDATIELLRADFGTIHLYDPERQMLQIASQRGFEPATLVPFAMVSANCPILACGRAFGGRSQVAIDDVERDPDYEPYRKFAAISGYRALQATPLLDRSGKVLGVLSTHFQAPRRLTEWELQQSSLYAAQAANAIAAHQAEKLLHDSERRLHSLIEGIPQLIWQAQDDGRWIWVSSQWTVYTGMSTEASKDRGWLSAVHPDDRPGTLAAWRRSNEQDGFQADFRLWHAAGQSYRWVQSRAKPVPAPRGSRLEWFGTSTDVDELYQLQKRQGLLLDELRHRVRNMLAVIRSIARRTAKTSATVEDYWSHLEGRIDALARVQTVRIRDPEAGVDLESLIAQELLAHQAQQGERVQILGPPIQLRARAAETLGLAIHELVTNAIKYGALSGSGGRIKAAWQIEVDHEGEARLVLAWAETGVAGFQGQAQRQGFGMELLKRTLSFELKATATVLFEPGGLHWHIEIPLSEHILPAADTAVLPDLRAPSP